jgi:stage V sporulation protein AE
MIYFNAFLFAGFVSMIGQVILDHTKLTPGHITSLFVVIGSFLDVFNIYDKLIKWAGGGAMVPITSFGHSLVHASLTKTDTNGLMGLFMGMFDLTAPGIVAAIVFSFIFTLFFKARD